MICSADKKNTGCEKFRIASRKWAEWFLENKTAVFFPDKRVPRAGIEGQLKWFIDGNKTAAVIVGASGVGKSFLTCTLIRDYLSEGHLVLAYDGSQLQGAIQSSGEPEL